MKLYYEECDYTILLNNIKVKHREILLDYRFIPLFSEYKIFKG